MAQENPILKFKQLSEKEALDKLQEKATDAQWDATNAKSPKLQRQYQDDLNLFGSLLELFKKYKQSNDIVDILNASAVVAKGDDNNG